MSPFHQANGRAASQQLANFVPQAGLAYTKSRNYDAGPNNRNNLSMLSPWIRIRLLSEWTVLKAVLAQHPTTSMLKIYR